MNFILHLTFSIVSLSIWCVAVGQQQQSCGVNKCLISTSNGKCFETLEGAVSGAPNGGKVYINGVVLVAKEIKIDKAISFVGCGNSHTIYSVFNDPHGAIFRVVASQRYHLSFQRLNFERKVGEYCSFLRTPELGDGAYPSDVPYAPLDLTVTDCTFKNFKTAARGGGTLFVGRGGKIYISGSSFLSSAVARVAANPLHWESGGGAVWIREALGSVEIQNTVFADNRHYFQHGNGGALVIDLVDSGVPVIFGSAVRFVRNKAPGGGAMYVGNLYGTFKTAATFEDNENIDGWGTRGGALWLQNIINAKVQVSGSFIRNKANVNSASSGNGMGRGGAIASNKIDGTDVHISARFIENQSLGGASIWDGLSGGLALGGGSKMTFENCVVSGNKGADTTLAVHMQKTASGPISLSEQSLRKTVSVV